MTLEGDMIPIEETPLYKMCRQLVAEYDAYQQHTYSEELAALHSRTIGALMLKVSKSGNRTRVSFVVVDPVAPPEPTKLD